MIQSLFPRVRIDDGASVSRSILFERAQIGKGTRIQNCIVEKHVHVPITRNYRF